MYHIGKTLVAVSNAPNRVAMDKSIHNRYKSLNCQHLWNNSYIWSWNTGTSVGMTCQYAEPVTMHLGARLYCITDTRVIECYVTGSDEYWDIRTYTISSSCNIDNGVMAFNCFGDIVGSAVRISTHRYIIVPIQVIMRAIDLTSSPTFVGLCMRNTYHFPTEQDSPPARCVKVVKHLGSGSNVLCRESVVIDVLIDQQVVATPHYGIHGPSESKVTIRAIDPHSEEKVVTYPLVEFNPFKLYLND